MVARKPAQKRRPPRLSDVVESPHRNSNDDDSEDVRNRRRGDDDVDQMRPVMAGMHISPAASNGARGLAVDDVDDIINHVEDDFGILTEVKIRPEDLTIDDNPEFPDLTTAEDKELPERQRGLSMAVRLKYSRVRDDMSNREKVLAQNARYIKKTINEAFRSVFQARDNVNQVLVQASQKLINCYKKARLGQHAEYNLMNLFYQQIDVRLAQIMEEVTLSENRGRLFKLVTTVALELVVLGFGNGLVELLLDYVETWTTSHEVSARMNSVIIACFFFETGMSRKKALEETPQPIPTATTTTITDDVNKTPEEKVPLYCDLDLEVALRLFRLVKRSLCDKDLKVRCPAIRGMGIIQSVPLPSQWPADALEASPRELIVRSMRDRYWECRLTAVRCFTVTQNDVRLYTDIISFDKSNIVRVAGLEKVGEMKPNWEPQLLTPLMITAFRDHDVQVRDAAKGTLRNWITMIAKKYSKKMAKQMTDRDVIPTKENGDEENPPEAKNKGYILAAQALVLVFYVNTPVVAENQGNLRRVVHHLLDVLRTMYHCKQDMMKTFVEQIAQDIATTQDHKCGVPLIMRSTISTLLEINETVQGQDLNTTRSMVFFWRCMVEFCVDNAHHAADKTVSLNRFLLPLKTMVDHFEVFLQRVKFEEQLAPQQSSSLHVLEVDVYVMQMSLVENYLYVLRHCEKDTPGKEAYKQLLISMMMNPFYQKRVFDMVFQEMAQFYTECPEDLFSLFKARITEMRMKWRGEMFPEIEGTVLVGSHKTEAKWDEEEKAKRSTKLAQGTMFINKYEIKILNCLLKMGLLPHWDNEYESRYGKMIRENIANTESTDSSRVHAIECLGMIGTYDFDLVHDDFRDFIKYWTLLKPETIQASVVVCLADLYLMNSKTADDINKIMREEHAKTSVDDLRPFLGEILVDENLETGSELLLRAVEAICRILLNSRFEPDDKNAQRVIVSLMHRASLKLTDTYGAKLRSTILTTLSLFGGMSQRNQLLIVNTFPAFFHAWTHTPAAAGQENVLSKMKRVGSCFVSLTRHSCLPPLAQARSKPAQLTLVRTILDELESHAASDIAEFYLSALPQVEFESFDNIEQRKLFGDLQNMILLYDEADASDRVRLTELRKAKKKLARIIGINEDDEMTSESMMVDTTASEVPGSRAESRATTVTSTRPSQSRRRGGGVISRTSSMARVDEAEEDGDGGEESEVDEMADDDEPRNRQRKAQAARNVQDIMASPQERNVRKPASRPTTASRSTRPPSTRSTPMRTSARRLNQD